MNEQFYESRVRQIEKQQLAKLTDELKTARSDFARAVSRSEKAEADRDLWKARAATWKEVADALTKCATEDGTCDAWSEAFQAHFDATASEDP